MVQVKISELSKKIKNIINQVENGEICLILKNGTAIAEIIPFKEKKKSWKREIDKINLLNNSSAQEIIENERYL